MQFVLLQRAVALPSSLQGGLQRATAMLGEGGRGAWPRDAWLNGAKLWEIAGQICQPGSGVLARRDTQPGSPRCWQRKGAHERCWMH